MSTETSATAVGPSSGGNPHDQPTRTENEPFGLDDVFHLLQNQRRRWVLHYLRGVDETVNMGDLSEQIAAWEHDTTVDALRSAQRQRVYIALYQRHLPKLDDKGVIDYNQSRGRVTPRRRADQLVAYLDRSHTVGRRRQSLPGPRDRSAATGEESRTAIEHAEDEDSGTDAANAWTNSRRRQVRYSLVASVVACVALVLTALGVSVFATATGLATGVTAVTTALLLAVGQLRG